MKHLTIIFLLLTIAPAFSGCKKERLFDYRNKFTGDFEMHYEYAVDMNMPGYSATAIHDVNGTVYYRKSTDRQHVFIDFEDGVLEVIVGKDGTISSTGDDETIVGSFSKDKDRFRLFLEESPYGDEFSLTGKRAND